MKILFMGTPDGAATCLQALIDAQEQIICVVTQPDRKKGRGMQVTPSPVKLLAQKYNIEVLSPEKAKDQVFIDQVKSYNPDLIVVAAYGKILPKQLLDIPKFGAINVHTSLLPKYRGAAPIQRAILNGESKTGVTIMQIAETLDTGDIILQQEVAIEAKDNAETLLDKLFQVGASLLLKAIEQFKNNAVKRIPQNDHDATYAELITKETGEIDWKRSAIEIKNQVRALIPWPTAHTYFERKILKIWEAEAVSQKHEFTPGQVFEKDKNIYVACGSDVLMLNTIQFEGGKKMSPIDFAKGHKEFIGSILPS